MFVAVGVGAYGPAMFHLLTHAFFKAMLFLGAGSVIHAMHHEQDMRNYGGLRKKIPATYWATMIGTLAITGVGIPFTHLGFAGFFSKDAIIESAYASGIGYAFWMLVIAALFTSFYSWRLIFLTFYGKARGDKHTHDHAHESPKVMLIPLGVLALGAIFSGMVWYGSFFGDHDKHNAFFGIPAHHAAADGEHGSDAHGDNHGDVDDHATPADTHATEMAADDHGMAADHGADMMVHEAPVGAIFIAADNTILDDAHHVPAWVKLSPFVAMLIGFVTAWVFYIKKPDLPRRLSEDQQPLYQFLLNKWYFDELYNAIFIKPALGLGRFLWQRGDVKTIDGAINGLALGIVPFFTRLAGRMQSGFIFTYAFAMVLGVVVLITWMSIGGGAH
jgi:NADH-quinone oxidoreductase subunit L